MALGLLLWVLLTAPLLTAVSDSFEQFLPGSLRTVHLERPIDQDKDGYFEALSIQLTVGRLHPGGRYQLHPHITVPELGLVDCRGPHAESRREFEAAAQGDAFEDTAKWIMDTDARGTGRIELIFDGEDLSKLRTDGPWTLATGLFLRDSSAGQVKELMIKSQHWRWRQFGSRSVYGETVQWSMGPDSARVDLLVRFIAHRADTLRLAAHAGYDDFAADTLLVLTVLAGSGTAEISLNLEDANRERSVGVGPRLKLRLCGLDFGFPLSVSKDHQAGSVLSPNCWEAGPWPRSPRSLYR